MHRSIMIFASTLALTSCISFPYVYSSHPGHHYRLSWRDLSDIDGLVSKRPEIHKPIDSISMLGPDCGEVTSGHLEIEGGPMTIFAIRKSLGRWSLSDVRQTTVVSTD